MILVGLLVVLDLLLTFGVIRRLREHTELLSQRPSMPDIIAAPGTTISPFAATTVEGDVIADADLVGGTMVGFFSPGCGACTEQMPAFLTAAKSHPGGQERVLAVVTGRDEDTVEQVQTLSPVARVVVVEHGHDVEKAFAVSGYPAFALMGEGGSVAVSGSLTTVAAASANA
ncbi:hypothetical protein WEH80_00730 [Actinomycetes bacterium KLBMP 9759]